MSIRISPEMFTMTSSEELVRAKATIDFVIANGSVYINKNRKTTKCCLAISLTPCGIYSIVARIISCPFQCLFNPRISCNPLLACLSDSSITMASDKCISGSCDNVDKKRTVSVSMLDSVNQEIIFYAAAKIQANDPKIKYAITDAVHDIMRRYKKGDITPDLIVRVVALLKP